VTKSPYFISMRPPEDRPSPTYAALNTANQLVKDIGAENVTKLTLGELDVSPSNTFLDTCKAVAHGKASGDILYKLADVPGDKAPSADAGDISGIPIINIAAGCNYPPAEGTLELRRAAAWKFSKDSGIPATDKDVIVSLGGKAVLALIGRAFKPGDEVLVAAPGWPTNYDIWRDGVEIVEYDTKGRGLMTAEELKKALTDHPGIKAVLINDPCNPTGARYTPEEREAVMKVLNDENTRRSKIKGTPPVLAIMDDPYGALNYNGAPLARGDEEKKIFGDGNQVVVNSVSKVYARPDIRIGWAVTKNHKLLETMKNGIQTLGTSAQVEEQNKAQLLLLFGDKFIEWTKARLKERAESFATAINNITVNGKQVLRMDVPQGAIYGQIHCDALKGAMYEFKGETRTINTPQDVATFMSDVVHAPPVEGRPFFADKSPAAEESGWFLRTVLTAKEKLKTVSDALQDKLQSVKISWQGRGTTGEGRKGGAALGS
jgi:aspartate/methionine/tyrosine aminotransferase